MKGSGPEMVPSSMIDDQLGADDGFSDSDDDGDFTKEDADAADYSSSDDDYSGSGMWNTDAVDMTTLDMLRPYLVEHQDKRKHH